MSHHHINCPKPNKSPKKLSKCCQNVQKKNKDATSSKQFTSSTDKPCSPFPSVFEARPLKISNQFV